MKCNLSAIDLGNANTMGRVSVYTNQSSLNFIHLTASCVSGDMIKCCFIMSPETL
jgi:hypothetical protein